MATHSNILAWRIPMDRGVWWATVHGVTESDTTELLRRAQCNSSSQEPIWVLTITSSEQHYCQFALALPVARSGVQFVFSEQVFSRIPALSSGLCLPCIPTLGVSVRALLLLYPAIPGSLALASLMTEGSDKASVLLVQAPF